MLFPGSPSEQLPEVLATGASDADFVFLSLSARDPTGRDADYLASMPAFIELGAALDRGGRMAHRLPSVEYLTADIAGRLAAPHALAGADVIPWRPALGVYVIIEDGYAPPDTLLDAPGVAGIWWFRGSADLPPYGNRSAGKQITYCYLDEDPVAVAG